MSNAEIVHTSDANFENDVLKSPLPVLVDFWAEWCGPCKAIAPVLDELAATRQGKLKVVKLNVDENGQVPAKFNIRGIPTLLLFKDGQLVAQKVGGLPKATLNAFINAQLGQLDDI